MAQKTLASWLHVGYVGVSVHVFVCVFAGQGMNIRSCCCCCFIRSPSPSFSSSAIHIHMHMHAHRPPYISLGNQLSSSFPGLWGTPGGLWVVTPTTSLKTSSFIHFAWGIFFFFSWSDVGTILLFD